MCLKIVNHTMICDVRPVMRHPSIPNSHIVNPFTVPEDKCCAASNPKTDDDLPCPTHGCCQITVRSFPCECGNTVGYHRYTIARPPSAYTIETANIPSRGVWRKLQSLDDIPSAGANAHPAPSGELQIARRGFNHAVVELGRMATQLEVASRKKGLKEANLKNGAPYEKQVQTARAKLEQVATVARDVQKAYYTWMHMKNKFEQAEYGKVSAVEMSA
ncbi:hypothetical protein F5B22DRAFT_632119 [Xylaria bambusicola]|uniref:uncharacterized protein n=1 Tax=Xylaria bambusicola TaxID=326684 RepID=UPI0020075C84|nr:uncharacterized protein F5B22DRAFT_632119 [Xylaria bambusicola]KAI0502769.1 hypothetical protein F5B22DRAFT_632119 [Xylaria bambusicola]